jgi:microcin C transport system permease protein
LRVKRDGLAAVVVELLMGLLGFQAAIQRDYPVMFGTLYLFTLVGLLLQIVGDLLYTVVDPRIDFEARG